MRLTVGITGATGAVYGVRLLQLLRSLDVRTDLVVSAGRLPPDRTPRHTAENGISPAD